MFQEKFKYNLGMIFVALIQIIGVVLLFLAPSFNTDFNTTYSILTSLGKLFGVLGITLFATSLLLSARFKFLENIFYGLNKVYERHSQIGQIAFMMMLFHPLLLLYKYTDLSFGRVLSFFTPSEYTWANNFGMISLYLLIVLIFLTLYFRPKYHIWKWTHKFMGLAFFLGGLHADTSTTATLQIATTEAHAPLHTCAVSAQSTQLLSYLHSRHPSAALRTRHLQI
jgi:predicted ferric reductase